MNCAKVQMLMFDYIDNQLDYQERSQFEEHLRHCSSCSSELYKYELIVGLCNEIEEEELPSDFRAKLHERLVDEANKQIDIDKSGEESRGFSKYLFRNRYVKTLTALAAGLLFVILFRGVFLNQYLFNNKTKSSAPEEEVSSAAYSASIAQEKDSASEDFAVQSEDENNTGDSGGGFLMMAQEDTTKYLEGNTTDTARSYVERSPAPSGCGEGADDECITTVDIVLKLENAESGFEDVMNFMMNNGAEPVDDNEEKEDLKFSTSSERKQEFRDYRVINARIPDKLYDSLLEKLTDKYGTENLSVENISTQDIAPLKKALTDTLNNIEKDYRGSQNVESMKQSIRDEIERLIFDASYMYINVKVMEKE